MEEKYNSDHIAKHIADVLLEKELEYTEEFGRWIEENDDVGECLEVFSDKEKLSSSLLKFGVVDKEAGADELMMKIGRLKRRRFRYIVSTAVAAVIAVSLLVWHEKEIPLTSLSTVAIVESGIVAPTLVLSDGDSIPLDGDTVTRGGKIINSNGVVLINANDLAGVAKLNRLIVPSRNFHSIVLSDGTKVLLNANSELEFPERFGNAERVVTLKGEGYFEVAKDSSRKFIVKNSGQSVVVYGTKFNINGYNRDHIYTLLLNGSVSVAYEGHVAKMLKPMQIANVNTSSGDCVINDVADATDSIAWIDDLFSFSGTPLKEVIAKIETWYGVTLDKTSMKDVDVAITGSFCRKTELSEILQTIEKIAKIKIPI